MPPPFVIPKLEIDSPIMSGHSMPEDPNLRVLFEDVLDKFRYSLASVASEEQPGTPGEIDDLFRRYLGTRSAPTRARLRERGRRTLANSSDRAVQFGRYAAINDHDYRTFGSNGVSSRVGPLPLQAAALEASIKRFPEQLKAKVAVATADPVLNIHPVPDDAHDDHIHFSQDAIDGAAYKKMRLTIHKVKCLEETSEVGDDEISMGGTVTAPNGKTLLIGQFTVSTSQEGFEEGEVMNPEKVFATWELAKEYEGFPYVYAVVIVMSEKDDGGFYKFLKDLWEKVAAEVKAAVAGLVGAAIGAALGSAFLPPLGTVIGAFTGLLLGLVVELIINAFDNDDDIVAVMPWTITLGWYTKSYYEWANLIEGLHFKIPFNGDGGRYMAYCSYKIATQ